MANAETNQQSQQQQQEGAGESGVGSVVLGDEATLDQHAAVNHASAAEIEQQQRQQQEESQPRVVMGAEVVEANGGPVSDAQLPEVVKLLEVGGSATQPAIYQLIEYCASMDPKKRQTTKSIEDNQLKLLNALYVLLAAPASEFRYSYAAVLALVRRHRSGCFGPSYRNRGLNSVELGVIDNKNMRFLTRVVDLLAVTVDTPNIELLKKHYDIKKLMEAVPSVVIRQNLTAYYSA